MEKFYMAFGRMNNMTGRWLLLLAAVIMPFVMNGNTLLEEGMKWRTQLFGTHEPNLQPSMEEVTIEKSADADCFVLYRSVLSDTQESSEPVAFVRTEGEKVFFKPMSDETAQWYLLYDFGLQPGDGCVVYSPMCIEDNSRPYMSYIKCVGINEKSEYDGWVTMELEEYEDESCSNLAGRGTWIKGLSSLDGILYNNRFGVDGFGSKLVEVYKDGQLVFSRESASSVEIFNSSTPEIRIDGLKVYVSVGDDISGSLYSQAGLHIGDYRFSNTPVCINLPDSGVYILKIGDNASKILIP